MLNIKIVYKNEKTLNMFNLLRKYYPNVSAIIKNRDSIPISNLTDEFIVKNPELCYQFIINEEHQRKATLNCMAKFVPILTTVKKSKIAFTNHILFKRTEEIINTLDEKIPHDYLIYCYGDLPSKDFENFVASVHYLKNVNKITKYYVSELLILFAINDIYVIKISFGYKPTRNVIVQKYGSFPLFNVQKGFIGRRNDQLIKKLDEFYKNWNRVHQKNSRDNWNDPIIVHLNPWDDKKKSSSNEKGSSSNEKKLKRKRDSSDSKKSQPNSKKQKITASNPGTNLTGLVRLDENMLENDTDPIGNTESNPVTNLTELVKLDEKMVENYTDPIENIVYPGWVNQSMTITSDPRSGLSSQTMPEILFRSQKNRSSPSLLEDTEKLANPNLLRSSEEIASRDYLSTDMLDQTLDLNLPCLGLIVNANKVSSIDKELNPSQNDGLSSPSMPETLPHSQNDRLNSLAIPKTRLWSNGPSYAAIAETSPRSQSNISSSAVVPEPLPRLQSNRSSSPAAPETRSQSNRSSSSTMPETLHRSQSDRSSFSAMSKTLPRSQSNRSSYSAMPKMLHRSHDDISSYPFIPEILHRSQSNRPSSLSMPKTLHRSQDDRPSYTSIPEILSYSKSNILSSSSMPKTLHRSQDDRLRSQAVSKILSQRNRSSHSAAARSQNTISSSPDTPQHRSHSTSSSSPDTPEHRSHSTSSSSPDTLEHRSQNNELNSPAISEALPHSQNRLLQTRSHNFIFEAPVPLEEEPEYQSTPNVLKLIELNKNLSKLIQNKNLIRKNACSLTDFLVSEIIKDGKSINSATSYASSRP